MIKHGWKLTLTVAGSETRMVLMFHTWDAADQAAQAAMAGNVNRATVERMLHGAWHGVLDLTNPPHIPTPPAR